MDKEIQRFERNLLWLGNTIIAVVCAIVFVAAPHLPSFKKAEEPVYKLSHRAYLDTVRYMVQAGELDINGPSMYSTTEWDIGYGTPPHNVLPHKVMLYTNVIVGRQPRIMLTVHYVYAAGKTNDYNQREYKFHTHYFYADNNLDGRPDEIQRRYIETNYSRPGTWITDNFKVDHWGYWDKYLVEIYRMSKEAEYHDMESLDSSSNYRDSFGFGSNPYDVQ